MFEYEDDLRQRIAELEKKLERLGNAKFEEQQNKLQKQEELLREAVDFIRLYPSPASINWFKNVKEVLGE